jgi:hypothetical protein
MSKKISVTCPHCGKVNEFLQSDLVSGMPIRDDEGNIIEEYPEVEVDACTFIKCDVCGAPVGCGNATISD